MVSKALAIIVFISLCAAVSINAQKSTKRNTPIILPNHEHDARLFLSRTQKITFKKLYPDFDEPKAEKNWEWKDIDPLGLYSPEENRKRRRELFLYEFSSSAVEVSGGEPTREQLAFRIVLNNQFEGAEILMSNATVKVSTPYTNLYEQRTLPTKNLLEKVAQVGLEWAQVGGRNLYLYNGTILMAKYKSGYVSLVDLSIDRPASRIGRR